MTRTMLFDLGNVLLFFSHERMWRQIAEVLDVPPGDVREILFESHLEADFERGHVGETEFRQCFERLAGHTVDVEVLRTAASDIFELNAPIVPLLDRLRSAGIRLVLLSNTNETHIQWVKRKFDLLDRFDDFVLSYEVGALKPEAAIYEAALTKIACRPEECLYTDDLAGHVEAARRFGLDAELFIDVETLRGQLRERGLE